MRSPDDFDTLIERNKSKSVTYGVFGEAFNLLLEVMTKAVAAAKGRSDTAIAALEARVAALEARVAALEAQAPGVSYKGIWDGSELYQRGHFVTKAGSIWHCERDHTRGAMPGVGDGWKLPVKRGAHGKDGKGSR